MAAKQSVIVKGQRNGISIMLDDSAEFEQLQETLREKVASAKQFFEGAKTNVAFKGRNLTEEEEQHLIDIILKETSIDVGFVEGSDYIAPKKNGKKRDTKDMPPTLLNRKEVAASKIIPLNPEITSPPSNPPTQINLDALPSVKINAISDSAPAGMPNTQSDTAYYRGGLRSGQSIKYHGSVVIMGDVNPGSEVVAGGNVIIMGALKGMAHAGSKGDASCFVSALVLQPTQLRIGKLITNIAPAKRGEKKQPSYAYVKDDQVFIATL